MADNLFLSFRKIKTFINVYEETFVGFYRFLIFGLEKCDDFATVVVFSIKT